MDVRSLAPDIAAFIAAPRYAVIATHESDGGLWQAVVWYEVVHDGLLMNARDGRRWLTNLRRDSRLSLVIADGEDYVILRGEAEVTDDPVQGLLDARSGARRYGSDETFEGQTRVSVLFHPAAIGLHGELRPADRPATY